MKCNFYRPISHVEFCIAVGPVGSKLSDKFGCRAVTMTGGLLMCIGLVLSSLATRLFHVYLALGVVAGMNNVQCRHCRRNGGASQDHKMTIYVFSAA